MMLNTSDCFRFGRPETPVFSDFLADVGGRSNPTKETGSGASFALNLPTSLSRLPIKHQTNRTCKHIYPDFPTVFPSFEIEKPISDLMFESDPIDLFLGPDYSHRIR